MIDISRFHQVVYKMYNNEGTEALYTQSAWLRATMNTLSNRYMGIYNSSRGVDQAVRSIIIP